MTKAGPIVFVGLDACEPAVALDLASRGRMPTLSRLLERGTRCAVRNPFALFVNALWMTFATALRADRHQFHCWDEIDLKSYRRRLATPRCAIGTPFWRPLSAAGRRTAVIDVPHALARGPSAALEVVEWGCHDRHFGFHTWPAIEAARIEERVGLHPVFGMDAHASHAFAPDDFIHRKGQLRTAEEERLLLDGLLRGIDAKRRLSGMLLADAEWDLFLTVFGESHAVGHQQWHLHDPDHPRFDAATVAALGGDPVEQVYEKLDAALGELLPLAGEGASVLVLMSHGMGPHYDGTHLLDEILRRIDLADRAGAAGRYPGSLLDRIMGKFSGGSRSGAGIATMDEARRRAAGRPLKPCREFARADQRARQRFFGEPNNYVYGGVRLNLAGREPNGQVTRQEADEVSRRLIDDLCQLVNLDTGGPVISGVERADRSYRRSDSDTMPDLFIDWVRSGPIETVWSPKTGLVHSPYVNWRTGDHRSAGLLVAAGPGFPAAAAPPEIKLEDIAPSIAARLGVALDDVDGRPVAWLAGQP